MVNFVLYSFLVFFAATALMVWARKSGRDRPAAVRWLDLSVAFAAASVLVPFLWGLLRDVDPGWATMSSVALSLLSGVALYIGARRL